MQFQPEVLAIVIGFMVLANRLVEALVTPVFDKYQLDKFWLMYVAWVFSGLLVFLANVNLFEFVMPNMLIGQILTAVVAGGGSNLLHDLTDRQGDVVLMAPEE
jgi:hypothetical protein